MGATLLSLTGSVVRCATSHPGWVADQVGGGVRSRVKAEKKGTDKGRSVATGRSSSIAWTIASKLFWRNKEADPHRFLMLSWPCVEGNKDARG